MKRYLLGGNGFSPFNFYCGWKEKKILEDLRAGVVTLTKKEILSIPNRDAYLDVYVLLVREGYAAPLDNSPLFTRCLHYLCSTRITINDLQNFARADHTPRLLPMIQKYLLEASDKTFQQFLLFAPIYARTLESKVQFLIQFIPTLLDSKGAKELSWWSHEELDKIRIMYEMILGKEHPLTKCLVQRWLLDLKELYKTEKAIQRIQMNQYKEELMMNRWHPDRVMKFYEDHDIEFDDM